MAEAVDEIGDASKLALEFYDRNRVATCSAIIPALFRGLGP